MRHIPYTAHEGNTLSTAQADDNATQPVSEQRATEHKVQQICAMLHQSCHLSMKVMGSLHCATVGRSTGHSLNEAEGARGASASRSLPDEWAAGTAESGWVGTAAGACKEANGSDDGRALSASVCCTVSSLASSTSVPSTMRSLSAAVGVKLACLGRSLNVPLLSTQNCCVAALSAVTPLRLLLPTGLIALTMLQPAAANMSRAIGCLRCRLLCRMV